MTEYDAVTDLTAASTADEENTTLDAIPQPRIRWAGIVWGLVFVAVAMVGAALTWAPGALDDLATIVPQLDAATLVAGTLMALGALALICGLVGLLRHAQSAAARRRV